MTMKNDGIEPSYCDKCHEPITDRHVEVNIYDIDKDGLPEFFRTRARYCRKCVEDETSPITI